jgi:hypothetical protein
MKFRFPYKEIELKRAIFMSYITEEEAEELMEKAYNEVLPKEFWEPF